MPSLLRVHHGITDRPGMVYGIGIHVNQIVKIFEILTGHHVAGAIGIGKGIQKGLQTSLEQMHERIFGLIFATAAQDGMFQNVRYTRTIFGWSTERDPKDFIVIIDRHAQEFGTTLFVLVQCTVGTVFRDNILPNDVVRGMSGLVRLFQIESGWRNDGAGATRAARCCCR